MDLDPQTWWYVSRATGFVGWALLAASVLWGLFITTRTLARTTPPSWVLDLHRHLGGLAVAFVAVHLAVLPLDTYTDWGWADLFVPMASRWHPIPIAFGIVALYLLLAIEISSLLGRRVPRTWWRRIHLLSFPLYVIASVHLFTAGTDAGNVIARWSVIVVSAVIAGLTIVRVVGATRPRPSPDRIPAAAHAARSRRTPPVVVAPSTVTVVAGGDLLPGGASLAPSGPGDGTTATATLIRPAGAGRMTPPTVDERARRIRAAAHAARDRVSTVDHRSRASGDRA